MQLEYIVSMANRRVRLQFLAMERSLRAAGCDLPLRVIPYDDDLFDLPANASWWHDEQMDKWLGDHNAHRMMRKYRCLLIGNFHFVDADICFVRDPAVALENVSGWVASCTEWNKPEFIATEHSLRILAAKSSTWQKTCFSGGQFACDVPLYASFDELRRTAERPDLIETAVRPPANDQEGLNVLVADHGIPVTNLTLPPHNMESTWAGDYPGEYEPLWADPSRKPYLIHWAGPVLDWERPINDIFYGFLTAAERAEWDELQRARRAKERAAYRRSLPPLQRAKFEAKQAARAALRAAGVESARSRQL